MKNILSYLSCSRKDRRIIFNKCAKFYYGKEKPYLPREIDNKQKEFLRVIWKRRFPNGTIKCHIDKSQFSRNIRDIRCILSNDKCRACLDFFYAIYLGESGIVEVFNKIFDNRVSSLKYPKSDRITVCFYDLVDNRIGLFDKETSKIVFVDYRSRYDVTSYESFFNKSLDKKDKLKTAYVDKRLNKRINSLNKKLKNIRVTKILAKEDIYDAQPEYFKLWYKDRPIFISRYFFAEIPIKGVSSEYANKKRLELQKKVIAWVRYKSLEPVYMTDKEYCQFVKTRTNGRFKPYKNRYPSTRHGDRVRKFVCTRCGTVFVASPNFLTDEDIRCPVCERKQSKQYSKQAIRWLEDLSKRFNLKIRHAENGGEFGIKFGKKTHHVDGYCIKYNIVFEYHGSRWHGNPTVYYIDEKINPYNQEQTAFELLKKTLILEQKIIKAGYNYIRIWDSDFLNPDRYKQWLALNTKRIEIAQKQS